MEIIKKELHLTPVERRMLELLQDGESHTKEELYKCLDDDLARMSAIRYHICKIRDKIEPLGERILCEILGRKKLYRQIVHLKHVPNRRCLLKMNQTYRTTKT